MAAAAAVNALRSGLPHLKIVTRDLFNSTEYKDLLSTYSNPPSFNNPPFVVLCPKTPSDVSNIIKVLRQFSVPLTVRSGGHDFWSRSTGPVKDGFILNLRELNHVRVIDSNSAVIGGGTSGYEVAKELHKYDLIAPMGGCPSVGYVSWACAGGYGMQSPWLGLGVDQVLGATIVDSNGDIIEADEELLWAVRGAGTSFGVIVEMRIKTYHAVTTLSGSIGFPAQEAETILKNYLALPVLRHCGAHLLFTTVPGVGEAFVITISWGGDLQEGWERVDQLRKLGTPIFDNVNEMSVLELMDAMKALATSPVPLTVTIRTVWMKSISTEGLDAILRFARTKPAFSMLGIHHAHHESDNQPLEEISSFGGREANFMFELLGSFPSSEESSRGEAAAAWVDDIWKGLQPYSLRGGYPSIMSPEQNFADSYSSDDWSRLLELKCRYDGRNYFKFGIPNFPPLRL